MLGSTVDTCTVSVYGAFDDAHTFYRWSLGDYFKMVSVFNAQLGSIVDTCIASVYGACEEAHIFPCFGLWEMTSRLSPYSALSLVRQRIHVWRQSTRLSGRISRSSRVGLWETTSCLSPYSALSLGRQWIHVGFSLRGFWKNFTRFLREGVQFLVRFLSCPLLCTTCAGWSRQWRIAGRCRRCSSCAVVDVAVFMPRQVPGSPG